MTVVPMKKVKFYVHKDQVVDALRVVQSVESTEFIAQADEENELDNPKDIETIASPLYPRVLQAISFLSAYELPSTTWSRLRKGTQVSVDDDVIKSHRSSISAIELMVADVEELQKQEIFKREHIKNLKKKLDDLSLWKDLPYRLDSLTTDSTVTFLIHSLDTRVSSAKTDRISLADCLKDKISSNAYPYHIHEVDKDRVALTIATSYELATTLIESILTSCQSEVFDHTIGSDKPAIEIENVKSEIALAEDSYAKTIASIESYASEHLEDLRIKHDVLDWEVGCEQVIATAKSTSSVAVLKGWIKEPYIAVTKNRLKKEGLSVEVEVLENDEHEDPPVEIENSKFIRPFEFVTRLYGLPGHKDLDPTLFLAGFFFIFFGLSLTDVGYGVFLMFVALLMIFYFKLAKHIKQFSYLLFLMGLGSTLVGLLFGGYFGIDPKLLPSPLQALQQFDPISNPLPVFYLALGLGVVQVMFGMVLKIVSDIKNGKMLDGVLDQVPWLSLFVVIILYGSATLDLMFSGYVLQFEYLIYGSLVSIVLTSGRRGKSIIQKIQYSLLSLYQSINYFSDILSYSRLLALGLATTALAFAVNLIAEMVYEAVPYVGAVFALMVLIIGHTFTLAVNTLGAFIHSARLQFVEFFGKFVTSSGRVFKPLMRREEYVSIKSHPHNKT